MSTVQQRGTFQPNVRRGNTPEASSSLVYGRRHRPDYMLLLLCAVLLAIGVVVVYAISSALVVAKDVSSTFYVNRQLVAIALSVVAFVVTSQFPLEKWRKLHVPLLVLAGLTTLVALLMPTNPDYPAHRWIRLGVMSFQSVELLKFAVLIWLAGFLSWQVKTGAIKNFRSTLKPLGIAIVLIAIVVGKIQSDLGSTGVMVAMIGSMAFVAGLPLRRVLLIAGVVVIGTALLISSTPYRRERLATFMNPERDCVSTGYQACQALIAVGSGGIAGQGLGRDVQAFGYLPEAENDSIFAVYAEKFGFIGSTLLIGIFIGLFGRMKRIAERAPDMFSRLLVVGVLTWLSVQATINIGAMIGLLPLKGITLPFISYGGTSVLFVMAAVGLVFQVSKYTSQRVTMIDETNKEGDYDDRYDRRRERGTHYPTFSSRLRG